MRRCWPAGSRGRGPRRRAAHGRGPLDGEAVVASAHSPMIKRMTLRRRAILAACFFGLVLTPLHAQSPRTQKPPLHAAHWLAITGKPLAATAGAMMFEK